MPHRLRLSLPALLFLLNAASAQSPVEFHVSGNGDDRHDASASRPVKSLAVARDRVRAYRAANGLPDGGIRVRVHAGAYDLDSSFVLTEADGGTEKSPVTWSGAGDGPVYVTGGRTIDPSRFRPVRDAAVLTRLDPAARKSVRMVDLHAEGVRNLGTHRQYGHSLPVIPATLELFFNGEPMTLARYPNSGMMLIGKVEDMGSVPRVGDKSGRGAVFAYTDPRHKRWAGIGDIWIQGTLNYGFADDYCPVASIDTVKGQVRLAKPHLYGVASGKDFQSYVAINILEELDSPGEWYVDAGRGILYFWPPASMKGAHLQVSILEDPVICLEGTQHLKLENLTVEAGRGIGIYQERSHHTLIAGCTVRNMGTAGIFMGQGARLLDEKSSIDDYSGVPQSRQVGSYQNHIYRNTVWDRKSGHHNGVLSCDVYNTGSGGITLSGGDKRTLTPGSSFVENTRVHRYNRRNKFTWAGIRVDGCGNRVAHNEIFDSDWHGIFVHGNDHVFEFNHVHDMTQNSNDTSPWYMGRNPSDRGNIVRYNFFDNCGNPKRMNMGIYCDDSSADVYVFGNVFNDMKTDHGVLFSNSGWHLVMRNNIVVNPLAATAEISAHYYSWYAGQGPTMFGPQGLLRKRLEQDVDFRNPPYSTRYPSLLPYLDVIDEGREWQGMRSRGNLLEGNLIVGGPEKTISLLGGVHAQMEGRNNWHTGEDPGFVDMKNKNFSLRPDAKAFTMIPGFQPIPFEKMGLYKDAYRK